MDPKGVILNNVRDALGCNGCRNFVDLGKMRQATLEKRLHAARHKLTVANMASIYTVWLLDQLSRIGRAECDVMAKQWCKYLNDWGCTKEKAFQFWITCAEDAVSQTKGIDRERTKRKIDAVGEEIDHQYPGRHVGYSSGRSTLASGYGRLKSAPNGTSSIEIQRPQTWEWGSKDTFVLPKFMGNSFSQPLIGSRDDPWKESSSLFMADVAKPPARDEMRLSVPNDYTCRRCGQRGHFSQACPTDTDPSRDVPPRNSYICLNCGQKGDHYAINCPKTSLASQPGHDTWPSVEKDNTYAGPSIRYGPDRNFEGRLSPWDEMSSPPPDEQVESCNEAANLYDSNELDASGDADDFLSRLDCLESDDGESTLSTLVSSTGKCSPLPSGHPYLDSYHGMIEELTQRGEWVPDADSWIRRPEYRESYRYTMLRMAERGESLPNVGSLSPERVYSDSYRKFVRAKTLSGEELPRGWTVSKLLETYCSPSPEPSSDNEDLVSMDWEACSSPINPKCRLSIQPYMTKKRVSGSVAYDPVVMDLFRFRENFWVNPQIRPTALDMWHAKG